MTVPLNKTGFSWEGHKSALWWLGVLYRRSGGSMLQNRYIWISSREFVVGIFLHFLPYLILLTILGRVLIYGIIGFEAETTSTAFIDILFFHGKQIALGIASGTAVGFLFAGPIGFSGELIVRGMTVFAIAKNFCFSKNQVTFPRIYRFIILSIIRSFLRDVDLKVISGIAFGIVGGIVVGIADESNFEIVFGIAGGLASGIASRMFL